MRILSVVKEIGKSLVVFKLAFSEEDLHGILDGNCVNSSECFLDFFDGDIKVVFKAGHRGYKGSGSSTDNYSDKGVNIPSKRFNVINKWLVFFNFNINVFLSEFVITVFEFNKLDCEIGVNVVWRGSFVWEALDAKNVGFEAGITMTFLCITCAWEGP